MTRREILSMAASAPAWACAARMYAQTGGAVKMGGTPAAFSARLKTPAGGAFDVGRSVPQARLGGSADLA